MGSASRTFLLLSAVTIVTVLCVGSVQAQSLTAAAGNNSVCLKADWKGVPFFGAAVSADDFAPEELSAHSSYYRGPVQRRAIPTATLAVLAIALLLIFIGWRIVWCCCACCCGWCCVTRTPYPEEVLGSARMLALKIIITLLSLGVAACCAYGMSKIDPRIVDSGLSVIDSIKGYMNSVFDVAYGVLSDVNSVNSLLDSVQTILDDDVNITDISAGITCVAPFVLNLNPGQALGYLSTLQYEIARVVQPDISALSGNLSTLTGSEVPPLQGYIGTVSALSPYLQAYKTQTASFIDSVNNLPGTYPTGGKSNPAVQAVGTALSGFGGLPLAGGASSKTGHMSAGTAAFNSIYSAKSSDVGTLSAITTGISGLSGAASNLSLTLPAISSFLLGAKSNYSSARPCMLDLLSRLQDINIHVITLPSNIFTAAQQLQQAQLTLDAVLYNATVDPAVLAASLTAAAATLSVQPFSNSTVTALQAVQTQYSSFNNPNSGGGPNQFLSSLSFYTNTASGDVDQCNTDWQACCGPSGSDAPADYNTMVGSCSTARDSMNGVQTALSGGAATAFFGAVAAFNATGQYLAGLPSNSSLQASLASATASISSVPDVSAYISALTPVVSAYGAMPANTFTDLQTRVTSLDSTIQQAITTARGTVNRNVATFTSKANDIHNKTVDQITAYEDDYMPYVQKYDKYRQAAEYVYFALGIVVCLGVIFSVLTNCQFGASFFTASLLILTAIFSVVAVIFYAVASIGNDGCQNAEAYLIRRLPDIVKDPSTLNKTLAVANYYLLKQGGGVNELMESVAGINLTDIFQTVNQTRDNAIQQIVGTYTLQDKMQAVVDGVTALSNNVTNRLVNAESLATYNTIHPLYIQAKTFVCCSGVNMMGNLWASMFAAGSISIFLVLALFIYIQALDSLPSKACCGCTMRSNSEFETPQYKDSNRHAFSTLLCLDIEELELQATSSSLIGAVHGDSASPSAPVAQRFDVEASGGSRGSLLAPTAVKRGTYPSPSYALRAGEGGSYSQVLKNEYMQRALRMDSAGLNP